MENQKDRDLYLLIQTDFCFTPELVDFFPLLQQMTGKGRILQRQTDMEKDHSRWGIIVRTGGEMLHFLRDEILSQQRAQEGRLPGS